MFSLDRVSKYYADQPAVHELSLVIPNGKTTAIIGPSGCGKSTILGLLTGLLRPSDGAITFEGAPLTAAVLPAVRLRIGYVIQDGGLFPHLNCLANVTLMARHLGWPAKRITARVQELAKLTRLPAELLPHYPAELSGGQRQRVSLMRALMLDPDVLLLDEPLAALDPIVRAQLQDDLAEIFRRLGKTVALVTHDMTEAALFADQIILMRDGRIVQSGNVDDLMHRPAEPFVKEFVWAQLGRSLVGNRT